MKNHTLTLITYYDTNPEIETLGETDDPNDIPKIMNDKLQLYPIDLKYFTEILPYGSHNICGNVYLIHHVNDHYFKTRK
jgi:hypothetical protein